MKRLLTALGALLVLVVGEMTAPTAQADAVVFPLSGYEVVSATVPVAAGATGATGVDCPEGKRPVGGGVNTGNDDMRLIESFPLGGAGDVTGWLGAVFNGGTDSVFDVYAVCARVSPEADYEAVGVTNVPVAVGTTGSAAMRCPAGKRPLGGGVYTGDDDMRVVESFPTSSRRWAGAVFNGSGFESVMDVYVICARVSPGEGYEVVGVGNVPVAVGATASAAVDCPAGKRPLGGGVSAGSDDLRLVETFPLGAPLSPTGWTGTVFNGGDASTTFDVYAVCAPVPTD